MRIGLYFGSFNPIHVGHLAIAGYFAQFTELDQVWFVVSPHNPFKDKKSLLKGHHRLAMVRAAIEDCTYLNASDAEFSLPQPSFTSNTLAYLGDKFPRHQFYLIMGSDSLEGFPKWRNAEAMLEHYRLMVFPRMGHDGGELRNHPSVYWADDAPQIELSSTMIRRAIAEDKDVRCFVPERAWKYLDEMNFYK
jgi:nicotinate-nucleotide adenylyltransferase